MDVMIVNLLGVSTAKTNAGADGNAVIIVCLRFSIVKIKKFTELEI